MSMTFGSEAMIPRFGLVKAVYCFFAVSLCFTLQPVQGKAEQTHLATKELQGSSDAKKKSASGGKWLPIPTFLTEPAIGYGLGMALGYIHPEKEKTETRAVSTLQTPESLLSVPSSQKPPPTITGVAAGYTQKESWFGAVGHSTSWSNDKIRYAGFVAYADVKSTYFILDHPLVFNLVGSAFYQGLKFRLGSSKLFLGGNLVYLQTTSKFETTIGETDIALGNITSQDVGIAAEVSFDGRDNVFTPNSGQFVQAAVWRYVEGLGGDYSYWKGTLKALSFHQMNPQVVLGMRLEVSAVDGRPPFYAYPWVTLRGIPAMRYQGKCVGMVEVEGRWNILPRWAVLGFVGKGAVSGDDAALETRDSMIAGGVGGRYLFMPDEGLWLGIDAARGPENWYTYVTVGSAW